MVTGSPGQPNDDTLIGCTYQLEFLILLISSDGNGPCSGGAAAPRVRPNAKAAMSATAPRRRRHDGDHHRRVVPWYGTLSRAQWNTLLASNLGWLCDGYENYSLILTVGFALRQLLDPSRIRANPDLCRNDHCVDAARMGNRRNHRRHPRRLFRPQAHDALRDPRLFADDRIEPDLLELGILCDAAFHGRHRDRLGMGYRSLGRIRAVAGPGTRPRRRAHAMRVRDWAISRPRSIWSLSAGWVRTHGDICSCSACCPAF